MNYKHMSLSAVLLSVIAVSGCSTVPKEKPQPPTAGQVVGKVVSVGIDEAIRYTSKGIQYLINRPKKS